MSYSQNICSALSAVKADEEALQQIISKQCDAILQLVEEIRSGIFPAFTTALHVDDLLPLSELALRWSQVYTHVIFLGVGGSSLGAQTLVNFMGKHKKNTPELIFIDNVDPTTLENILKNTPLASTAVVATSKSGGTIETLSQVAVFIDALKQENLPINEHVYGITEETENPLRTYLKHYSCTLLNHPKEVGGRFTAFTLVSLLPALLSGMNVVDLRQGAAAILNSFLENPEGHPATQAAALSLLMAKNGKPMHVMMPYSDRLQKFSQWFVQLWAESLGKEGMGTSPIPAVGSTDQHSFLQLMMEGPNDKFITLIYGQEEDSLKVTAEEASLIGQPLLNNLSFSKLIHSQAKGTADALADAGKPVRRIELEKFDTQTLGELIMHFMLETATCGALMNINTWNQPGVEESKKRTLAYL